MEQTDCKKLYRSTRDRMISGVCGGIAEYFNIDSTIVRILWVLLFFTGGMGLLLYIAAMIIVPVNPDEEVVVKGEDEVRPKRTDSRVIWGTVLIILGILFFVGSYGIFLVPFSLGLGWGVIGPVIIIVMGLVLIFSKSSRRQEVIDDGDVKRLYRQVEGRMFLGVAGGTGEYFNIDPTIGRLIWAAFIIITGGFGLIVYLAMYFILPEKSEPINSVEGENE